MYIKSCLTLVFIFAFSACSKPMDMGTKGIELTSVQVIKSPVYWVLVNRPEENVEFFINGIQIPLVRSCKDKQPCKTSLPANAWLRPHDNKLSIKYPANGTKISAIFALAETQMAEGKVFPKWHYDSDTQKLKIDSQEPKLLAMLVADPQTDQNEFAQNIDLTVNPSQIVILGPQHSQLEFKTKGSVGELVLNGVPIYSAKEFFNLDFGTTLKKNDPESRVVQDLLNKGFGQTIFEPWTKFLVEGKNSLVYRPKSLPIEFENESVQLSVRFGSGPLSRLIGPGFLGRDLFSIAYNKKQLRASERVLEFYIPKYVQRPWQIGKAISINSSIQDQIKIRIREAQHVLRQGNKGELQQLFRTYLQYQERVYGDDIGQRVVEYWAELAKSPGFDFYEQGMDKLSYSLYFDERLLRVKRNDLPALLGYNDNHEQILFPSYFILRESGLEFALD